MNTTKSGEIIAIILITLLAILTAVCLTEELVVKRMSRQSIEGYRGFATYKTNAIGEVSVDKLSWEKK